jgi:hypothetical protein
MAPFANKKKNKINMKLDIRVRLKILLTEVGSSRGIKTHAGRVIRTIEERFINTSGLELYAASISGVTQAAPPHRVDLRNP